MFTKYCHKSPVFTFYLAIIGWLFAFLWKNFFIHKGMVPVMILVVIWSSSLLFGILSILLKSYKVKSGHLAFTIIGMILSLLPLILILIMPYLNQIAYPEAYFPTVKKMITEKTIKTILPEGGHSSVVKSVASSIDERSKEVALSVEGSIKAWNNPKLEPEKHYESCKNILENIELNENEWLTLGNIIKHLGAPSSVEKTNYSPFDLEGNVKAEAERFFVYYKDDAIKMKFSASGFLSSLLFKNDGGYSGSNPIHWPHDYSYAKEFPLITGTFSSNENEELLVAVSPDMIMDQFKENEGGENLSELGSYEVDVFLIDGVLKNLSQLFICLKGNRIVHCHTWWQLIGNQWTMISEEKAYILLNNWRGD